MTTPATAIARVPTAHASRYLQQLCKHWGHKFPTEFDPAQGRIELPFGICALAADPAGLTVELTAIEPDQLAKFEEVVVAHIVRFAFREELVFDWQVPGQTGNA